MLRPNGRLVFNISTPIIWMCWGDDDEPPRRELRREYFSLGRVEHDDGDGPWIEWQLGYGQWIRLFRSSGFILEDLIELRPKADAATTYTEYASAEWARAFPGEHIWKLRKAPA